MPTREGWVEECATSFFRLPAWGPGVSLGVPQHRLSPPVCGGRCARRREPDLPPPLNPTAPTGKGPTFTALLHRCVRSIADPELPVRIDASVAVRAFLEAVEMEDLPLFKDLVPSLLTQFLQLSQEVRGCREEEREGSVGGGGR